MNRQGRAGRAVATAFALVVVVAATAGPSNATTPTQISGTVTAADGSGPIAGITVCANRAKPQWSDCADTAADGSYHLAVRTGTLTFHAEVTDLYGDWVPQAFQAGKAFTVKAGTQRMVDFVLVRGATIDGYVQAPTDGGALDGVHVSAYRVGSTGRAAAVDTSFSNVGVVGTRAYFKISKLPAGTYKVAVDNHDGAGVATSYGVQWYPAAAAASAGDPVTVTTGQQATLPDIALQATGSLTVSLRHDGKAIKGRVEVMDIDGRLVDDADVGKAGSVTVPTLIAGPYKLRGSPWDTYYSEWYDHQRTVAAATTVPVTAGATTSRTLTLHYPTLKPTTKPTLTLDANELSVTLGRWNAKPASISVDWYRDGKLLHYDWINTYITHKSDVGHRLKACLRTYRDGYAPGLYCTRFSRKITSY